MSIEQRALFETAVVERLKESGFLEIEIRTECLVRCDDGYQDEVINAGWHYWNTAIATTPALQKNAVTAVQGVEAESLQAELAAIRNSVRNAMGAIESNQVVDKDVHGTLNGVLKRLDALVGAKERKQ